MSNFADLVAAAPGVTQVLNTTWVVVPVRFPRMPSMWDDPGISANTVVATDNVLHTALQAAGFPAGPLLPLVGWGPLDALVGLTDGLVSLVDLRLDSPDVGMHVLGDLVMPRRIWEQRRYSLFDIQDHPADSRQHASFSAIASDQPHARLRIRYAGRWQPDLPCLRYVRPPTTLPDEDLAEPEASRLLQTASVPAWAAVEVRIPLRRFTPAHDGRGTRPYDPIHEALMAAGVMTATTLTLAYWGEPRAIVGVTDGLVSLTEIHPDPLDTHGYRVGTLHIPRLILAARRYTVYDIECHPADSRATMRRAALESSPDVDATWLNMGLLRPSLMCLQHLPRTVTATAAPTPTAFPPPPGGQYYQRPTFDMAREPFDTTTISSVMPGLRQHSALLTDAPPADRPPAPIAALLPLPALPVPAQLSQQIAGLSPAGGQVLHAFITDLVALVNRYGQAHDLREYLVSVAIMFPTTEPTGTRLLIREKNCTLTSAQREALAEQLRAATTVGDRPHRPLNLTPVSILE